MTPETPAGLLVRSYALQSRGQLEEALETAKQAVILAPDFGFGWSRVAELEFSFGRPEGSG